MSAYDENLLAAAPAVTREQMQESYSIDLLKNSSTPEVSTNAPLAPSAHGHDLDYDREAARPSAKERVSPALMASVPYERPWYRTKKWTVIFIIAAVVVVAAVVGGAVGGTVGHKSKNNNNSAAAPTTSGAAGDGGGAAGAPDQSGGNVGGASGSGSVSPTETVAQPQESAGQVGGAGGSSAAASSTPAPPNPSSVLIGVLGP